jgi:hypothetical protein
MLRADLTPDVDRIRRQLTQRERESTARTVRETVEDFDAQIANEETRPMLEMFSDSRAVHVARLTEKRSMIARQARVAELSLVEPWLVSPPPAAPAFNVDEPCHRHDHDERDEARLETHAAKRDHDQHRHHDEHSLGRVLRNPLHRQIMTYPALAAA